MSCYSTPPHPSLSLFHSHSRCLMHTLSMLHIRVTEALCHAGWSFKGHREPSKDTDTETPVYTVYIQPTADLLYTLTCLKEK